MKPQESCESDDDRRAANESPREAADDSPRETPDADAAPEASAGEAPSDTDAGRAGEFTDRKGRTVFVLPPSDEYVAARSIGYRRPCLAALVLAAAGCAGHAAAYGTSDLGLYVLAVLLVPLSVALALRIWNMTIRSPLTMIAAGRLELRIANLKLTVYVRLGQRLGVACSRDGRYWKVYLLDHGWTSFRFKLAAAAFPDLLEFLAERAPDMWQDVPQK